VNWPALEPVIDLDLLETDFSIIYYPCHFCCVGEWVVDAGVRGWVALGVGGAGLGVAECVQGVGLDCDVRGVVAAKPRPPFRRGVFVRGM
jgi:hypothetical protein